MNVLIDNLPEILRGFLQTLGLLGASGLIALVLGLFLAGMRVAPVQVMRAIGTSYVNIFRNTPLVVLFIVFVAGLPFLGIQISFFARATVTLSLYTAAFVCEAIRSGINSVQEGQADAARSIGFTFTQTLRLIVLPQAFRSVIPPLASIFIALTKNTAIAEAFGVAEATYQLDFFVNRHAGALWPLFFGIALGYMAIVFVIAGVASQAEKRLVVIR